MKVVNRPKTPLSRNSQPSKIVTASVAIGGTRMAMAPKTSSKIPFGEIELPMVVQRGRDCALNSGDIGLIGGHGNLL